MDNMILPQLKAMSTTYNEHKGKYRKLKQAGFVVKERLKKAEREMHAMLDERDRETTNDIHVRQVDEMLLKERDKLAHER